jgi:Bacterial regulatory protein, Fis family
VKNCLEAMFINLINHCSGKISFWDLPEPYRRQLSELDHSPQSERERVLSTLLRTNWNMSQAAQQLSWSRMTLYRKLRKYHIVKSATLTRLSISATSADSLSAYVPYTAPPSSDRAQDDVLSCEANGSNCCVNQEI